MLGWPRAACTRGAMTDGAGLFHGVETCCPWSGLDLPTGPGPTVGLATMRSGPTTQDTLPHPRVPPALGLAPASVGPPHPAPVPASAPPLFLPPELGGPWGLLSLHRKRNRSCHRPLPVTSLVHGHLPLGTSRCCLSPGPRAPCWGLCLLDLLVFPPNIRDCSPAFASARSGCPPGLLPPRLTLQPTGDHLPSTARALGLEEAGRSGCWPWLWH